jgi:hypothetical protein
LIFLVPYDYDRMPDGKPRKGIPPKRLGGKARCDALIEKAYSLLKEDEESFSTDFCFVLVSRFSKDQKKPSADLPQSIAEQMAVYVEEKSPCFVTKQYPTAWGTCEETAISIQVIPFILGQDWPHKPVVYVSTNPGHMPRVWLCWFFLKPKGWKVHFVLANHSFTPKEWFQETAKFFQYLYRFVFKKW